MDKKTKYNFLLVAFGIILFAVLMNGHLVSKTVGSMWKILYPVALAFVFAFVFNVPMSAYERLLARCAAKSKRAPNLKARALLSLLLTVFSVLLVVALVFVLVIPAVAESVTS